MSDQGWDQPGGEENFWGKAAEKAKTEKKVAAARSRPVSSDERTAKRRKIIKWTIIGTIGAVVLGVLVLVIMLPTIAGWFVPGIVRDAAAKSIMGPVDVSGVSLSWGGPQKIESIKLSDGSSQVAEVGAIVPVGLWSLITGKYKLGEVELAGDVTVIKGKDGVTNLDRALKPSPNAPPPSKEPTVLPKTLSATINLLDVALSYQDQGKGDAATLRVRKLRGAVDLEVGQPAKVKLSGSIGGLNKEDAGTLVIEAKAIKWSDEEGLVTPNKAKVEAAVQIERMPTAGLDALAGMQGRFARGFGSRLDLTLTAAITGGTSGSVVADLQGGGSGGKVTAELDGGRLSVKTNRNIKLTGELIRAFAPDLEKAVAGTSDEPGVKLERWPSVELSLRRLALPMPKGPDVEVGEAAIDADVTVSECAGGVRLAKGEAWRTLDVLPVKVTLTTAKLSTEAQLTAATEARINGQSAGVLSADVTIGGLITRYGQVKPDGLTLRGGAALNGVATALLEPMLAETPLRLTQDVGPTLDVRVQGEQSAGAEPGVTLTVSAEKLNGTAKVALGKDEIRLVGEGAKFKWTGVGTMAARAVPETSSWRAAGAGTLELSIAKAGWAPAAAQGKPGAAGVINALEIESGVTLKGLRLEPLRGAAADAVSITEMSLNAVLKPGAPATVKLATRASAGTREFSVNSTMAARDPLKLATGASLERQLVDGGISMKADLAGVPTALLGVLAPQQGELMAKVAETLGDKIDGTLSIAESNGLLEVKSQTKLARVTVAIFAEMGKGQGRLSAASVTARVDQGVIDGLGGIGKTAGGGSVTGDLRLQGEMPIVLEVRPITLPMTDGLVPKPSADQPVTLALTIPEASTWQVKPAANSGAVKATTGPAALNTAIGDRITIEPSSIEVTAAPVAVIGAGGVINATLNMGARSSGGIKLGNVQGTASLSLAKGRPSGPSQVELNARGVDCGLLGAILGDAEMPLAVIGPTLDAQLSAEARLIAAEDGSTKFERLVAGAGLKAARTSTDGQIKVRLGAAGDIELAGPASITSNVDLDWLNKKLREAQTRPSQPVAVGAAQPQSRPMTISSADPLVIRLKRLRLPSPTAGSAMIPSEFELGLELGGISIAGAEQGILRMNGLKLDTMWNEPRRVAIRLGVGAVRLADKPATGEMQLTADIDDLMDPVRGVDASRARVSADASFPMIPTALIDAFAGQGGLLTQLLGDVCAVSLKSARYETASGGGAATLQASSPRATARVAGEFDRAAFRASAPVEVTLSEITTGISAFIAGKQPVFAVVEKKPGDQPAKFTAQGLSVPMAGDFSLLDGDMVIEPGEARVGLGASIAKLLKPSSSGPGVVQLLKYEPLRVTARKGLLTLARWSFPLDKFNFQTQGSVNLVKREVDILTWVPAGALTAETLSAFNQQLSGLTGKTFGAIDENLLVPLRTKGSLDNPSTNVELNSATMDELKNMAGRVLEDQLKSAVTDQLKGKIPGMGTPAPGGTPGTPGVPKPPG